MVPTSTLSRFFHYLLIGSVVGTIVGVSLIPVEQQSGAAKPVLAECEDVDSEVDDFQELEFLELFAVISSCKFFSSPEYADHAADDAVDTESAFHVAHLLRGPPLC